MLTEQSVDAAIAECMGARSPNANTCRTLAALLTIKDKLFSADAPRGENISPRAGAYSYAPALALEPNDMITYMGESAFARSIYGRPQNAVWPLIDELMAAIKTQNPRLYDQVMRRL